MADGAALSGLVFITASSLCVCCDEMTAIQMTPNIQKEVMLLADRAIQRAGSWLLT